MKQFKLISASVIAILIFLAAIQILWLKEMYSAKLADFNQIVKSAMVDAAYENYIDRSFAKQDEAMREQVKNSFLADGTDNIKSISVNKSNDEGRMVIAVERMNQKTNKPETTNITISFIETPDEENFKEFNKSLLEKLREQGIYAPFRASLLCRNENKILFSKEVLPDSTKSLSSGLLEFDTEYVRVDKRIKTNAGRVSSMAKSHIRVITIKGGKDTSGDYSVAESKSIVPDNYYNNDNYYYKVEIENPFNDTLKDIAGIITSSILIIVVIGLMFLYLLKTIMKQKRLEEMKDDFTHNITHELKTPVAVAYAANDALLNYKADEDPEKRKRYLTVISTQLKSLESMIERILMLTKESERGLKLNKEQFCLQDVVDEVRDEMLCHNENGDKKVEINASTHDCGNIIADRFHFKNMLLNLVDNSIKYSGPRVKIDIDCSITAGSLKITVTDNGNGISREALKFIFDKYYREGSGNLYNTKGVGLGLYYVKTVVAAHGGTVEAESSKGKVTTFTIIIPTI